jgi:hypothetical protein
MFAFTFSTEGIDHAHIKTTYTCQFLEKAYSKSMAQMTIYIDDATQKAVEAAAARAAVSISRWARERLQEAASRDIGKGSLDIFYGCIDDDSFREPEDIPAAKDSLRESLD